MKNVINCDIINTNTVLRTKKPGDEFTFYDRNVTKTVKKLFNELKIPKEQRDKILLAANKNTVLWIEGIGVSKQGKISNGSLYGLEIIREEYQDA